MDISIRFSPSFIYARKSAHVTPRRNGLLATDDDDEAAALAAPSDLRWQLSDAGATAQLRLRAGESAWFVLRYDDDAVLPPDHERVTATVAINGAPALAEVGRGRVG
ncbi:MAG: hypothetical protein ABI026_05705 [Gemmatimonadaceae bacterium]